MPRQFPYVAAVAVTTAVGTVTTLVWAAGVAPVPVVHPVAPGIAGRLAAPPVPTPVVGAPPPNAANPGNATNTPTSTGPSFPTGNVALQTGADAAPALTRAGAYSQAALNQPGQPPFSQFFVSQQTPLNQPGQPDIYEGTNNPNIVQANEGAVPARAYLNAATPETGVPPVATQAFGFATTQGNNVVGFYSGFGSRPAELRVLQRLHRASPVRRGPQLVEPVSSAWPWRSGRVRSSRARPPARSAPREGSR